MGDTGISPFRIADLSLDEVAAVPAIPTRTIGAFPGSVLVTSSDGLSVLDGQAQPVRNLEERWLVAAYGTLQLQPVEPDPDVEPLAVVETSQAPPDDGVRSAAAPGSGPTTGTIWALGLGAAALMLGAVWLRRRRGMA